MHSKLLIKELQVKNQSVVRESGWQECVVSKRRHREGGIEHKYFALIGDHIVDCIGTMRMETQGEKA